MKHLSITAVLRATSKDYYTAKDKRCMREKLIQALENHLSASISEQMTQASIVEPVPGVVCLYIQGELNKQVNMKDHTSICYKCDDALNELDWVRGYVVRLNSPFSSSILPSGLDPLELSAAMDAAAVARQTDVIDV